MINRRTDRSFRILPWQSCCIYKLQTRHMEQTIRLPCIQWSLPIGVWVCLMDWKPSFAHLRWMEKVGKEMKGRKIEKLFIIFVHGDSGDSILSICRSHLCPVAFVKCWSIIFCSLFTWQLGKLPKVCRSKVRCKHTVNFILVNYCKLCKLRIKGEKTKWSKQLQQGQSTHCSFTLCDLKWPCKSCNWKDDIFRAYVILCGT